MLKVTKRLELTNMRAHVQRATLSHWALSDQGQGHSMTLKFSSI